jgi:hypothetical protein
VVPDNGIPPGPGRRLRPRQRGQPGLEGASIADGLPGRLVRVVASSFDSSEKAPLLPLGREPVLRANVVKFQQTVPDGLGLTQVGGPGHRLA